MIYIYTLLFIILSRIHRQSCKKKSDRLVIFNYTAENFCKTIFS